MADATGPAPTPAPALAPKGETAPSRPPPASSPPTGAACDPEEDDLSDLDDVLDELANTKIDPEASTASTQSTPPAAPSSSGLGRPDEPSPAELLVENEEEFAKRLQEEMEHLLGQGDFQAQLEDMMKAMSVETGENPLAAAPSTAGPRQPTTRSVKATAAKADKSFQDTINKTMERMQTSSDTATSAAASSSQDDMLAQMLAAMGDGGFGGDGKDEDFSKVLMGMMEQLTTKEVLYEPMKELDDKFPMWMKENRDKVAQHDWKRYEEQQSTVKEIVARFEKEGYSDDDAQDREYIVERMQKMQAAGSPPLDLVGDMNAAQEALQDMDQGCPTQ